MNPLLTVRNLHISFDTPAGPVHAVNGIDIDLGYGDSLALVGESGCGKSVTAQSLMGLLSPNAHITAGTIQFQGHHLEKLDNASYRSLRGRKIAMVFQDPMTALNPVLPIGKQITEGPVIHGQISVKQRGDYAVQLLSAVGIPAPETRIHQYPHQCSGGMRQRIMIAMALACSPALLIADEPTTALDVTVQANILRLLSEQTHQHNTSLLLISHDLAVVSGACNRIAVMYGGLIVETAASSVLFNTPSHPYTHALLRARPQQNRKRLYTIPGQPPDLRHPPLACPFLPRCDSAMRVCRQKPPLFTLADGHQVRCWLVHPACHARFQGGMPHE